MHWKVIPEFPKYSVGDLGDIRNDATGRYLRLSENQQGVITVGLMGDFYTQYRRSVPLLVAKAFLPKAANMGSAFNTPICLNGDRTNNRVDNLAWRPLWFARKYNRQFIEPYDGALPHPVKEVGAPITEVWPNTFEVARHFGLLEEDLVLSMINRTYVWPTYQQFEWV